jgi:hypothetical protein
MASAEEPGQVDDVASLPMSRNQIRRLGERLRSATVPSNDDLDLLQQLLAAYDDTLTAVTAKIRDELHVDPSPRLKNTGTIIEKLRRSQRGSSKTFRTWRVSE